MKYRPNRKLEVQQRLLAADGEPEMTEAAKEAIAKLIELLNGMSEEEKRGAQILAYFLNDWVPEAGYRRLWGVTVPEAFRDAGLMME